MFGCDNRAFSNLVAICDKDSLFGCQRSGMSVNQKPLIPGR